MTSSDRHLAVRRVARDFAAGAFAFVAVAACVAITEGQASGGLASGSAHLASSWVTTVVPAPKPGLMSQVDTWHLAATALLALTFGALTAFNLSLARHVRTVAGDSKQHKAPPTGF